MKSRVGPAARTLLQPRGIDAPLHTPPEEYSPLAAPPSRREFCSRRDLPSRKTGLPRPPASPFLLPPLLLAFQPSSFSRLPFLSSFFLTDDSTRWGRLFATLPRSAQSQTVSSSPSFAGVDLVSSSSLAVAELARSCFPCSSIQVDKRRGRMVLLFSHLLTLRDLRGSWLPR